MKVQLVHVCHKCELIKSTRYYISIPDQDYFKDVDIESIAKPILYCPKCNVYTTHNRRIWSDDELAAHLVKLKLQGS